MLHKLKEMTGGNEERMKVYISAFMEQVPDYCQRLEQAIEKDDLEEMRYLAHVCKPLLSMLGFDEMHQLADSLEKEIREAQYDRQSKKSLELLEELNKTVELLKTLT